MKFLDNIKIKSMFLFADEYKKNQSTLLRKPQKDEIGQKLITFVKKGDSFVKEIENTVLTDHVLAKNPEIIGYLDDEPVFNQWLIQKSVVIKNYGDILNQLSYDFKPFNKIATVKAIEVTREVLDALNISGDKLEFKVDWSENLMTAYIGDYLTNSGYSISKHDMQAYEKIVNNKKIKPN